MTTATEPAAAPTEVAEPPLPIPPKPSLTRSVADSTWNLLHRGCHRCLRTIVGHPPASVAMVATGYAVLPTDTQWWAASAIAAITIGALAPAGSAAKAELPSLATTAKRTRQLRRIRKRFRKAVGINGALSVTTKAEDGIGSPTNMPGHKQVPQLLRWRTRLWHNGGGPFDWEVVSYRPRMTPVGWVVYVDGNNTGHIPGAFHAEVDHMKGTWKARQVIAGPEWHDPSITRLSIIFDDPFAKTVAPESLPAPTEPLGCVDGVDSNGDPVEGSHWLPTLCVGRKGSGKSRWMRRRLQSLCESGQPFKLFLFDPKGGGQEFGWLRGAAWHYECDRRQWASFVQSFWSAMFEQAQRLAELGLSECPVGDERFPLIYIVVDELGTAIKLTSDTEKIDVGGVKMTVKDAFSDYLTQNRSAGSTMIAGAQQAQKEVLGQIRGLFDFCVCLGVNDRETAQIVLGDAKRFPAHEIPRGPRFSGQGFVATEDGIVQFRCGFTDDDASVGIAERVRYWTEFYENYDHDSSGLRIVESDSPQESCEESDDEAA